MTEAERKSKEFNNSIMHCLDSLIEYKKSISLADCSVQRKKELSAASSCICEARALVLNPEHASKGVVDFFVGDFPDRFWGADHDIGNVDTGTLCQEVISRVKEVKDTRSPVEVASLLATGHWIVLSAISGFEEGKEYGFFALGRIR